MHRRPKITLVALQLFAALAFASAVSAVGPREARASDSTASAPKASHLRASEPTSAQRRRRGRAVRDALLPGVWGGQHIRFEVAENSTRIELDCAQATVDGRIIVDRAGRFSVKGTYYQQHGGPRLEDEESRGVPVRLAGRVGGSLMKLTITRGRTQVGTYTLTRDREGRLFRCL